MNLAMTESGASLSDDRLYRYSLWRRWDGAGPSLTFIMLNPSVADAEDDDPTIRRCITFAQQAGYTGLVVVNLYALISTDPKRLWQVADPVGPSNDEVLTLVLSASATCDLPVVAAWGANARDDRVRWLLEQPGSKALHSLGTTNAGAPKHPLARGKWRIPDDAPLVPWPPPTGETPAPVLPVSQPPSRPKTSKTKAFKARCNLTEHRWERRLTDEERAEAKANGYQRVFVQLDSERIDPETRRHGRWEVCFPACAGFETDDPEAYLRHMTEAHNRPLGWAKGHSEAFAKSVRAGWRSPGLTEAGKPLPKETAALTRTCASCGLVAEVYGNAGELWWAEHERGCALPTTAAVAS